ncbi:MAG: septation protein A [Hyphomicrobiales bacterium]
MTETSGTGKHLSPGLKIAIEMGPLVAFFIANAKGGIFTGTLVYMAAAAIALAVNWVLTRRIAIVPVVTLGFVLAFGGLTLFLHDETFIKMKVTIINALFGLMLLGGVFAGKPLLKVVLGEAIDLDDEGWRKLSIRWGVFFFAIAVLNEIIWRSVPTDTWVNFKVFGILPITIVFAMLQAPLMSRHMREEDRSTPDP